MNRLEEIEMIRDKYGEWTAHNIEIEPGLFTMGNNIKDRASRRSETYSKLIRRFKSKKLRGLRILDLGCLEGGISIPLAQEGCRCVGVDVRERHLIKAHFAARSLGISRKCKWEVGDVTNKELWDNLGKFDVIICSGLLYHIEANDIIPLLKNIHRACKAKGMIIVDTNISSKPVSSFTYDGKTFWGCTWIEHNQSTNKNQRMAASWSSYKNNEAFWMTERSLTNALLVSGFDTVFKALSPFHEWNHQSRDIWLAYPGNGGSSVNDFKRDPDIRPINHPGIK